jgi:hypothetical protein
MVSLGACERWRSGAWLHQRGLAYQPLIPHGTQTSVDRDTTGDDCCAVVGPQAEVIAPQRAIATFSIRVKSGVRRCYLLIAAGSWRSREFWAVTGMPVFASWVRLHGIITSILQRHFKHDHSN